MLQEHVDIVCRNLMVLHDSANLAVILDPLALLKKESQIRAYQCHAAPHRCGDREVHRWMGWRMRFPETTEIWTQMASPHAPLPSPAARWVSRKRVKVATTKFGSTSLTSMLCWLTVWKARISPTTSKEKTDSFNSDHSLVVRSSMYLLASISLREQSPNGPELVTSAWIVWFLIFIPWSYDMDGHAKKCVERYCGLAKNTPATVKSYNSMPWWPSIPRRGIGICWRNDKSMLSNCLDMSVFGTHW